MESVSYTVVSRKRVSPVRLEARSEDQPGEIPSEENYHNFMKLSMNFHDCRDVFIRFGSVKWRIAALYSASFCKELEDCLIDQENGRKMY